VFSYRSTKSLLIGSPTIGFDGGMAKLIHDLSPKPFCEPTMDKKMFHRLRGLDAKEAQPIIWSSSSLKTVGVHNLFWMTNVGVVELGYHATPVARPVKLNVSIR
jgi:hypothetical protein